MKGSRCSGGCAFTVCCALRGWEDICIQASSLPLIDTPASLAPGVGAKSLVEAGMGRQGAQSLSTENSAWICPQFPTPLSTCPFLSLLAVCVFLFNNDIVYCLESPEWLSAPLLHCVLLSSDPFWKLSASQCLSSPVSDSWCPPFC